MSNLDVNVNVNMQVNLYVNLKLECKLKHLLDSGYEHDIRKYIRNITPKRYMPHFCFQQAGHKNSNILQGPFLELY